MRLKFKKALVTGGSSGIGAAIIDAFEKKGIEVVSVSRREGMPGRGVVYWGCDLTHEETLKELEERITQEKFDLVINAAGAGECMEFEDITPKESRDAWALMVEAPRRVSRAALPGLLRNKGALVNISSMAAEFPLSYMPLYNMSKAALSAMSLSLMDEYPELQIIDLRPGDIRTGFAAGWQPSEGKPWSATQKHLKKMIEDAPAPDVVVSALLRALSSGSRGTLRVGSFLQTVLMPFGARWVPLGVLHNIRRAYLKR